MNRPGPARPSLTAQLQEKLRQDRQQIEELTLSELRQLATSLSSVSRDALGAMKSDTASRLDAMRLEMAQIERRQRRWPLWTALSSAVIALAVFALLWMATNWARSDLHAVLLQRSEARQVLDMLRDQTHGVAIGTSADGTFLIGPEGTEPGWTCHGKPLERVDQDETRIASPGMLPDVEPLPHLKCSPAYGWRGERDGVGEHGDA